MEYKLLIYRVKNYFRNNAKMILTGLAILIMVVTCGTVLISRLAEKDNAKGLMITLSEVAKDKKPFYGKLSDVKHMSFGEMLSGDYKSEQEQKLEISNAKMQEILFAKNQNRKDKAAKEELVASASLSTKKKGELSSTVVTPVDEDTVAVMSPTDGYVSDYHPVYADENGTYEYIDTFILTGYCPCSICCGVYSNMENPTTASGTRATAGRTIAADAAMFPFGTQLVINGQIYTVEDRGGAIRGKRIDVFFDSHYEALQFGRRQAEVYRVME